MKYRILYGRQPMSVVAFLPEFNLTWDLCWIQEGAAIGQAAVEAQLTFTKSGNWRLKGALTYDSDIVQFIPEHYITDENVAKLSMDEHYLIQEWMTLAEYSQELFTWILSSGSVYVEKTPKTVFVERATHPILKTLQHWWTEYHYTV